MHTDLSEARSRRPLRRALTAGLCAVAIAAGGAAAAPLGLGAALPPLDLQNQHGQPVAVRPAVLKRLVFAADKSAADLAAAVLSAQPPGVLHRQQAVYVADVSAMPGLVFTMFALPKLRNLHFPVAIVKEAAAAADLPREAGRVTVLEIDQGVVTKVAFAGDARALLQALGLAAP